MAYQGFSKVEGSIEKEGYSKKAAGAITASIGRKKYGRKAMAKAARNRSSLKGAPPVK